MNAGSAVGAVVGLGLLGLGAWMVSSGLGGSAKLEPRGADGVAGSTPVERREPVPIAAAEAGDPERGPWIERNNAGVAALNEGDLERAIAEFEACVAAYPGDRVFASNLAEALFRAATAEYDRAGGDREVAVERLARAVELAPDREPLAELLDRWRRHAEVESDFAAYDSLNFELSFDGDRTEILHGAQRAIDVLEDAYTEYWFLLGHDVVRETGSRIRVVLYTPDEFRQLTGLGHWAGGAFDGTLRIPVDDFDAEQGSWARVLRHELLHAFVDAIGGRRVPGWLNEGLAQWIEGDRQRSLDRAERRLEGHALRPLSDLSGTLGAVGDEDAIGRAYAQSLLFIDFLMREYGEREVVALLEACADGGDPARRFRESRGFELDLVLEDLADELGR